MDIESQKNHLKSYGLAYWILQNNIEVDWLLNYRGGSFMFDFIEEIEKECIYRGISYEVIALEEENSILNTIADPTNNYDIIKLEKAPKIAVYSPQNKQPWDDAVTLVLEYAEIPYDVIYDQEILANLLPIYDWLHLHHEDFTGQYGKFYRSFKNAPWYIEQKKIFEKTPKNKVLKKSLNRNYKSLKKYKNILRVVVFYSQCAQQQTHMILL